MSVREYRVVVEQAHPFEAALEGEFDANIVATGPAGIGRQSDHFGAGETRLQGRGHGGIRSVVDDKDSCRVWQVGIDAVEALHGILVTVVTQDDEQDLSSRTTRSCHGLLVIVVDIGYTG